MESKKFGKTSLFPYFFPNLILLKNEIAPLKNENENKLNYYLND
jgi:hypothetical protein